eukprot:TRINITY_DN2434_c0_g1_i2.p2 TRINITY_DN2434_c0_g1~~TRINITY_DN2434_c0_g1_i2.p2  ORF type:complete len:109 (-),score=2.51 TRINITY_DN2434_c0_g1_i2:261-587(-)
MGVRITMRRMKLDGLPRASTRREDEEKGSASEIEIRRFALWHLLVVKRISRRKKHLSKKRTLWQVMGKTRVQEKFQLEYMRLESWKQACREHVAQTTKGRIWNNNEKL